MKRLATFFLGMSLLLALPAGPRPGGAQPGGNLPPYDARYLELAIAYTLNVDGSWSMEYRHKVRLDTYYAVTRAFGETFIVYNPDFQKLEVLKAETTMADGRKIAAPANAFNEVLPFAAHGFADFSGLREMVVTHTGLERGAVVELHYRILTKPGFLPAFSGREVLSRDFPVDSYKLEIATPSGRELRHSLFGSDATVTVSSLGGTDRYTFNFFKHATAAHEPWMHPQSEPFVVFSAAADWGQAIALEHDAAALPAVIAAKVEKLQAQYPERVDLLAALQKAVAIEVQNCGLGVETTGWRPRPLERVVQSNYATRLEKALLLRAMLNKAGFASELLAIAGDAFAAKVPTPLQMGEFWVKIPKAAPPRPDGAPAGGADDGSNAWYLDPCQEQQELFPYRCHGLDAYNLDCQRLEVLPASDWDQSGVAISGSVQLDRSGAAGTLYVTARGRFQRYDEAAADGNQFVTGLLKRFFPVEKVEIKKLLALSRHELRVEAAFSGPWLKDIPTTGTIRAGTSFFNAEPVRLPGFPENMVQLARRESPMLLEAPFKASVELELRPEAGLSLEYAAPDVRRENETGYFSRSLVKGKDASLHFSLGCGIRRSLIGPDKYPLLRDAFLPYFAPDFWLVFKKEK